MYANTWIDTNKPYELYIQIPELRTVINKRAIMMSSGVPVLCDLDGNPVESHWMLDLINKPNPTQSWSDVVFSLAVNDGLFNNSFAYCPERSFDIRNLIVPLPSNKIKNSHILDFLRKADRIFNFIFWQKPKEKPSKKILNLVKEREKHRKQGVWHKADEIRKEIKKLGWWVEDTKRGAKLKKL